MKNGDIMQILSSYNLFKHINFVSLSIISAKAINKIVIVTYRQIEYHRDIVYSKHIFFEHNML